MRERIVMFMPGMEFRETEYAWPGSNQKVQATMSPVAIIKLQRLQGEPLPTRVLALATNEVMQRKKEIEEAFVFGEQRIPVEFIRIPFGKDHNELREIIEALLRHIPHACDVIVDITHGFRGGPLVFSLAMQYLALLNPSVRLLGMYYGLYQPDISHIVDLSVYAEMLEWVYAMRVFRDTFVPTELVKKVRSKAEQREMPFVKQLEAFAIALDSAAPMEIAETATDLKKRFENNAAYEFIQDIPAAPMLFHALASTVSQFVPADNALPEELNSDELNRQAYLIDMLLEHGRFVQAVGLMFEFTLLNTIYHNDLGRNTWRHPSTHKQARDLQKHGSWVDGETKICVIKVAKLRNQLHHYGQTEEMYENLLYVQTEAERLWQQLKKTKNSPRCWRIQQSKTSRSATRDERRDGRLHSNLLGEKLRKAGF